MKFFCFFCLLQILNALLKSLASELTVSAQIQWHIGWFLRKLLVIRGKMVDEYNLQLFNVRMLLFPFTLIFITIFSFGMWIDIFCNFSWSKHLFLCSFVWLAIAHLFFSILWVYSGCFYQLVHLALWNILNSFLIFSQSAEWLWNWYYSSTYQSCWYYMCYKQQILDRSWFWVLWVFLLDLVYIFIMLIQTRVSAVVRF